MAAKNKATLEIQMTARDETAKAFDAIRSRTLRFAAQTSQVARRITSSFFSVRGAILGIGTALAAYSGARSFGGIIDELDELGKTARRLNLPVDAFNELQFAAQLAGVEVQKFSTGMRFFQTRVVDAANGNKQLAAIFEKLGVSLRDADGTLRSTEKLLEDLADAYVLFPEGAERSALAVKLFGEENSKLATLLEGSARGLRDARAQGAFFTGSVGDGTKTAEEFNDALLRVQTALKSLFREGAIELADDLTETINALSVLIAENREPLVEFFKAGGRAVAAFASTLIEATVSVAEFIREISLKAKGDIPILSSIEGEAAKAQAEIDRLQQKYRDFEQTIATSGNNPVVISGLAQPMADLTRQISENEEKLRSLTIGTGLRDEFSDLKKRFADLVVQFESGVDVSAAVRSFRPLEDEISRIQKIYQEGFSTKLQQGPDLRLPSVFTGENAVQSEFQKQYEQERQFLNKLADQRARLNEEYRTKEQTALEQDFALRFVTEEGYYTQLIELTKRQTSERVAAVRESIEREIEELRRGAPASLGERQDLEDQIVAIRRNGDAEIRELLASSVIAEREAAAEIKRIRGDLDNDKAQGKSFWDGFQDGAKGAGAAMTDAFENGRRAAQDLFGELGSSASREFAAFIRGAKDGEAAWQSFVDSILDGLAEIASQLVFKQLFGALAGFIGGSTTTTPAAGNDTGLPSATGLTPASSTPTVLASSLTGGTPFTIPRSLGLAAGSGNQGASTTLQVVVHQNIQHPDGEAFARAQAKQADQIVGIVAKKLAERPEFKAAFR